jgi:hypothetical protein
MGADREAELRRIASHQLVDAVRGSGQLKNGKKTAVKKWAGTYNP